MNPAIAPAKTFLFAFLICGTPSITATAQEWQKVTSRDGKVTVMVPGKPEDRTMTKRTLAGKITTYIKRFETDTVIFDLSYTPVSPKVIAFAGREGIYKNSKGKVLDEAMGKEVSFEDIVIDGVTCKLLRYQMTHPDDKNHKGYEGVNLMLVLEDALYIANGVVLKESGMEDIKKFRDSIVIKP